jgi:hypothetical protein
MKKFETVLESCLPVSNAALYANSFYIQRLRCGTNGPQNRRPVFLFGLSLQFDHGLSEGLK